MDFFLFLIILNNIFFVFIEMGDLKIIIENETLFDRMKH